MTFDLRTVLPLLIPKAIAWAEAQSSFIGQVGQPLNDALLTVARSVGVMHPELIRVTEVPCLPLPEDLELQQAALESVLLGPNMVGMTFGYGIYVCHGHGTIRLLSYEFRHSYQYEQAGSIAAFLPTYLQQIVTVGYNNAPFEIDACSHEKHHA
ncbi:MAG: hypothetical protein WBC07_01005 [Methylotenera sp.]